MTAQLTHLASEAVKKLPKSPIPTVVNPASGLSSIIQAWQNYQQVRAVEETKRAEIRSRAEVEITRIREQAQLMREYFTQVFAERKENFERSFSMLEAGLSKGDDKQIEAALTMILTLVKESPIRQAVETLHAIKERQNGQIIDL